MGWEARGGGGRLYYVSYRKVHGRVTRQYIGTGPAAELAAKSATERRAALLAAGYRQHARSAWRRRHVHHDDNAPEAGRSGP